MEKVVAVVTGASSGIGYITAKKLLENNYEVVGISKTKSAEFKNFYVCDVSNKEQIEKVFEQIYNKFGRIDVLINNAGFGIAGALEFTKQEELKNIFDVNVFGVIYCSNAVLKYMKSGAKIINISSACSYATVPYRAIYSATKSAVNDISFGYYMELKNCGISCCALCPGEIKTNFSKNRKINFETNERYGKNIERLSSDISKREKNRIEPIVVANKICKILKRKRLKPFEIVGKLAKLEYFALKFASKKAGLDLTAKIFNKKEK